MHSLPSILPSLYDWSFWVPFFFRMFLAFQLYRTARRVSQGMELTKGTMTPSARVALMWALMGLSASFFFGIGIQIVGALTACMYVLRLSFIQQNDEDTRDVFVAMALIAFSLVFLGPGPYAIDLPL
jgi:hypothetical protein